MVKIKQKTFKRYTYNTTALFKRQNPYKSLNNISIYNVRVKCSSSYTASVTTWTIGISDIDAHIMAGREWKHVINWSGWDNHKTPYEKALLVGKLMHRILDFNGRLNGTV